MQDNKILVNGESAWSPSEMATTVTVTGIHNPVSMPLAAMLNQTMQGGDCGHKDARGGSTNRGGTSAPPQNSVEDPLHKQQTGSGQAGWSALKVDMD